MHRVCLGCDPSEQSEEPGRIKQERKKAGVTVLSEWLHLESYPTVNKTQPRTPPTIQVNPAGTALSARSQTQITLYTGI